MKRSTIRGVASVLAVLAASLGGSASLVPNRVRGVPETSTATITSRSLNSFEGSTTPSRVAGHYPIIRRGWLPGARAPPRRRQVLTIRRCASSSTPVSVAIGYACGCRMRTAPDRGDCRRPCRPQRWNGGDRRGIGSRAHVQRCARHRDTARRCRGKRSGHARRACARGSGRQYLSGPRHRARDRAHDRDADLVCRRKRGLHREQRRHTVHRDH